MNFAFRAVGAILAALVLTGSVAAQSAVPIRVVLPFSPGGGTDQVLRMIAEPMGQLLNQVVLTVNRPGGDGVIAASEVARAAPDGLTLLFATGNAMIAQPLLKGKSGVPYDPFQDFTPISSFGRFTLVLVAAPGVPVENVAQLVEYVRARPGKLNYASSNAATRMAVIQLMNQYKLDMTYVPYRGDGPALQDLMADRVQVMVTSATSAIPLAKDGRLRPLVVLRDTRSPVMPNVPDVKEVGVRISAGTWAGLYAPAKLPAAAVDRLNRALRQTLAATDLRDRLEQLGFEPMPTSPAEMATIHRSEYETFRKAIQEDGIKFTE